MECMNLSFDSSIDKFTFAAPDVLSTGEAIRAGMVWDSEKSLWTTARVEVAQALGRFADSAAKLALDGKAHDLKRNFLNSFAENAGIEIPKPDDQQYDYRPFQRAGIAYALERDGTYIADDMGLGKTIQTAGIINCLWEREWKLRIEGARVLIVSPASMKLNWRSELRAWMTAQMTYCVARSTDPWPLSDIVIINFDILHKFTKQLRAVEWDLIVVDEASNLRNSSTRRFKFFAPLVGRKRIALDGTPYPNGRPIEAFTVLHWLDPISWPDRACMARWKSRPSEDVPHLEELQRKLRETVMVRREKEKVLPELPAKIRQVIELPSEGLRDLIEREKEEFRKKEFVILQLQHAMKEAREANDLGAYKAAVAAMRKAVGVLFHEMSKIRREVALAKLPWVIQHIGNALQSGKVVVFAHHHEVLDAIHNAFQAKSVLFDGRTSFSKRHSAVEAFQHSPGVRLFVGGIIPAGVGITLTAASHGIFAETDWVPGVLLQAEDRLHRISQKNCVLIQHLVLEGSLDVNMIQRAIQKQLAIEKGLNISQMPQG